MTSKKQQMLECDTLPICVKEAISIFTDEEVESLQMFFNWEAWVSDGTEEFQGIGFIGPGGKFTKFADPEKAKAISILEKEWVQDYTHEKSSAMWQRQYRKG